MIFIEAPTTMAQAVEVRPRIPVPTLYNWCHGAKSLTSPVAEPKSLGYRFILFTDVLYAVSTLLGDLYGELRSTGSYGRFTKEMLPFDEFNNLIGLDQVAALDDRYGAMPKA